MAICTRTKGQIRLLLVGLHTKPFNKVILTINKGKMMNITIHDQDKKVAELLQSWGIKRQAIFKAVETKKDWDDQQVFSWLIIFGDHSFDYFTGTGHCHKKTAKNTAQHRLVKAMWDNVVSPKGYFDVETGTRFDNRRIITTPTPASVLYCLLSDAECGEGNFYDFCDNFGYDQDSRKAFNTYEQCCDTYRKLQTIFTHKQINELREALEDY